MGTCKPNRNVCDSYSFKVDNNFERVIFVILYDRLLGIVTRQWKDSINIHNVSTVMKKCDSIVSHRKGADRFQVLCLHYIIAYQ